MTQTDQIVPDEAGFDFDPLLRANVERVFNERDPQPRLAARDELWSADPVLLERNEGFAGTHAISGAVEAPPAMLPPGTVFTPAARAMGHHGVGILPWKAGQPTGPADATGTDVAS